MEFVRKTCGIGQGEKCCRYLTMGSKGFNCEKHSPLKEVIDARVGQMIAKGDNCFGMQPGTDLSKLPAPSADKSVDLTVK